MTEIVLFVVLLLLAAAVVAGAVVYHVSEVRAEAAAWDALIARVRGGAS